MKQSEARHHLNMAISGVQKYRSNMREAGVTDDIAGMLKPVLFGERSVLLLLLKAVDSEEIAPWDYLNLRLLITTQVPEIWAFADLTELVQQEPPFAELMAAGWEEETDDDSGGGLCAA